MLRSDLAALARKYRWIIELRLEQHLGSRASASPPLRQLAEEFPGALRELDVLPLPTIEARIAELERALELQRIEPWMEWMHQFHTLMRVALAAKRRLEGLRFVDDTRAAEIADEVAAKLGCECDKNFVRAVASPPDGRLSRLVLAQIASRFEVELPLVQSALFPRLNE